jgi:flagellar basal-body rod modification protein FlgD
MQVSGIDGLGAAAAASSATQETMGKESFLKLLVAQLEHQDPLQPMENTEFVAQLAQFSSLEQLMSVNSNLSLLQVSQMSMTNSQVTGLIGKDVEAKGDSLYVSGPGERKINFKLDGSAKSVTIRITSKDGKLVRTLEQGASSAGLNSATWDGKDSRGNDVGAGSYNIKIEAKDSEGKDVATSTQISGRVTGVSYNGGVPVLEIGDTTVQVGDVIAIRAPASSSATREKEKDGQ